MTSVAIITLLLIFVTKHFILDFGYQPPFQWQNKGTYGHIGGIAHSGQHAVFSFFALLFFTTFPVALGLALFEFIAHYHIDWAKMNINKKQGWACNTHNEFWVLTGLDQYLHYLTYIIMIGVLAL